jgi:hypothetical protein
MELTGGWLIALACPCGTTGAFRARLTAVAGR